jgi:hypothetical protein
MQKSMYLRRSAGLTLVAAAAVALLAQTHATAPAEVSDEYLLMGDATRGAGEPMIAVDPTNPKNIIAVAMGNLQKIGTEPATSNMTDAYHAVAGSTFTWLAVTHDGGAHWTVGELPLRYGKFTRCPDSFAAVTADGTFLAGCEPRETAGEFYGTSAMAISTDKGDTWSKPIELISSYGIKKFAAGLKPRIGGNAPWDRPFLYIDDSNGVIYAQAGGGETDIDQEPGHYRTQSYITASTDKGKTFGTIYAWDSKDYPQMGRGRMTAGHGVAAVAYVARSAPASENATCPCVVFGVSRDKGKTFAYHVLKSVPAPSAAPARGSQPAAGAGAARGGRGPGGGPGNGGVSGLAADPTKAGRFVIMTGTATEYRVAMSEDYGQTWSPFVTAGKTPNAVSLTKPWLEYSRKGPLALVWRAIYADRTYDIWSSLSQDGGTSFSAPIRVSHAVSPGSNPARNAGLFGDDIQDVVLDDRNVHMVWGDSRSGFQAVWYGRVPIEAYSTAKPLP